MNRLAKERFDFVLYHRREMDIRCVIKLLPYGTPRDDRQLQLLREACQSADLTMLVYDMKPYRNVAELRRVVFSACGIDELEHSELSESAEQQPAEKPFCPKCNSVMQLTTLKKGTHAGQECWVCSDYPTCKGARLKT